MKSFNEWMEQRESYEPLIATNSVLFPVIHNQNVISTHPAFQKMQELIKKRVTIWHEGQEVEPVVEEFLKTPLDLEMKALCKILKEFLLHKFFKIHGFKIAKE